MNLQTMVKGKIEKTAKKLQSRLPLIGKMIRKQALRKLSSDISLETLPHLIKALESFDPEIALSATVALSDLKNREVIDDFCRYWFDSRGQKLEKILLSSVYIATKPDEIHIASALKNSKNEGHDNAVSVPHLLHFIADKDPVISKNAFQVLQNLKNQKAIDIVCNTWYKSREKRLDDLIVSSKHIAAEPLEIRIASALKTSSFEICDNAVSVPHLLHFMADKDPVIRQNTFKVLQNLKDQAARDVICEGIINESIDLKVKEIVIQKQYHPSQVGRRCLYFVITGQIEKYFDLDFEFEHLRAEYMAAPEPLQQRIRSVIQQSNDQRLMGMFGEVRRKFVAKDLSEHEAELMLDVYSRNRQWEEIFALLFFTPLAVLPKALDVLAGSGWEPAEEEQKSLWLDFKKERKAMGSNPKKPAEPEVALGPVFAKWIEKGIKEFKSKPEPELRELMRNGDPPEAIAALAAMFSKNIISDDDRKYTEKHPHWLVRMAYIALAPADLGVVLSGHPVDMTGGGEYWLKQSPALLGQHFMQLRAAGLNPEHLQQLNTAVEKTDKENVLRSWARLLSLLTGYTLRNTIVIGAYEKRIEDSAISL